jgi:HEAT repeat protein
MSQNFEPQGTPSPDDQLHEGSEREHQISQSPAGILLQNALQLMNAFGEDAEERYKEVLEALRANAADVMAELASASNTCYEDDYPFRWALTHLAAELRSPAALPYLRNVVLTPIPPERSKSPDSFSTVAEETIIRTTAIEGVQYLAEAGDDEALQALLSFVRVPSFSIRRAAVQGVLATKEGEQYRDRLAELLPPDQRFILDLRRSDVREVQQIEAPERTLRPGARDKTAAPRIPGQPEGDAPRTY